MPECLCAADRLEVSIKGWKQHPVLILLFAGLVSRKLNSLNRRVAVDFLFFNSHWNDLFHWSRFMSYLCRPQFCKTFLSTDLCFREQFASAELLACFAVIQVVPKSIAAIQKLMLLELAVMSFST